MSAKIIDGKQIAAQMRDEIKTKVRQLAQKGIVPGLAVVLVGDNPASKSYVAAKEKACSEIGIYSDNRNLPATVSQDILLSLIEQHNKNAKIHGILVQLPLPRHIDEMKALMAIDPAKDVDCFHPVNVGRMVLGHDDVFLPCTPHGVVQLLIKSNVRIEGSHIVIVGRSNIVGKPLANMLIQKAPTGNASVTICHTRTKNLSEHTQRADIIIAAAGRPNTVTADMVKEGCVVIDVGINRIEDAGRKNGWRLVGDVDFEPVSRKAALITPVPGGVGPMTITMLLYNTVKSAEKIAGI